MGARSGGGGGAAGGGGGGSRSGYIKGARPSSNPNVGRDVGSLVGQTVNVGKGTSLTIGKSAKGYTITTKSKDSTYTQTFKTKAQAQSKYNLEVYLGGK